MLNALLVSVRKDWEGGVLFKPLPSIRPSVVSSVFKFNIMAYKKY